VPSLSKGFAQPADLVKKLNRVRAFLPPDVVQWHYTVGNDWSGDPAIFFTIVITDDASKPENLRRVTTAITNLIAQKVDPLNRWDLFPYFTFRSQSEQAKRKDEAFQ
jgi:hypothetical protein